MGWPASDTARRRSRAETSLSELWFFQEHRDINIRRIAYVASENSQKRGIALCAPIAPYDSTRRTCGND